MLHLLALLACGVEEARPNTDTAPTARTEPTTATGTSSSDPGGSDPRTDTSLPTDPGVSDFVEVLLEGSTLVPTVHSLGWSSLEPQVSWVEVSDSSGVWLTPRGDATTSHSHALLGLKAGQPVTLVPCLEDEEGRVVRGAPIALDVPSPPENLPRLEITRPVPDPAMPERFWILAYYIGGIESHAAIYDQDGDAVWWISSPDPTNNILMAKPSLDGLSVLTGHFRGRGPGIRRTPLTAMSVDDQTFTPTHEAHHDFTELPGGRFGYLSAEYQRMEWGEFGEVYTRLDLVFEVAEGADSPSDFERSFDPRDLDVPLVPACTHSHPLESTVGSAAEWGHTNSLLWDATDDTFIINIRNLDTVMKIDRSTGQRVWSIGGPSSDFALTSPEQWFDHGHMSQWSPEGFTMFSNELHGGGSVLYHYAIDAGAGTIDVIWSHAQPEGLQLSVLGDVDRTPDGAYLASWSKLGTIERLTVAGDVSWRATAVPEVNLARSVWFDDLYDLSSGSPMEP